MDNVSTELARSFTTTVVRAISSEFGVKPPDFDPIKSAAELRAYYELAFRQPNPREILEKVGIGVLNDVCKTLKGAECKMVDAFILHDKIAYSLMGKSIVAVGRQYSDVKFDPNATGCSRLHALVFPLPKLGVIAVVDVGSFRGIVTEARSSGKPLVSSLPIHRRTLIFDYDESVVLTMGSQCVRLNPSMCVVCLNEARQIKFQCGHQVTCSDCGLKLPLCPICHVRITSRDVIMAPIKSYAV